MAVSAAFEDLVAEFELFDDWEERYRYVIELGREMPPLPDALRTDGAKVEGCASQVWLVPELRDGGTLDFQGDSDAMIVRGLIAVLHRLFAGQPVADVAGLDAKAQLARLGLDQALSAQRSNGLAAMVARLQGIARDAA